MNITTTTTLLGALGVLLLIVGVILILAGLRVITFKQYIEIAGGAKAFLAGLVITVIGILLLLPEARATLFPSPTATPIADIGTSLPTPTLPATTAPLTETSTITPISPTAPSPIPLNTLAPLPASSTSVPPACDNEGAFRDGLNTASPLFWRPDGFLSGWLSSDPATITLPDGTSRTFDNQFVLVVEDLPWVQVEGVSMANGKAHTTGCWYTTDQFVEQDALQDMCVKQKGGSFGILYRVSSNGIEELETTQTIACP